MFYCIITLLRFYLSLSLSLGSKLQDKKRALYVHPPRRTKIWKVISFLSIRPFILALQSLCYFNNQIKLNSTNTPTLLKAPQFLQIYILTISGFSCSYHNFADPSVMDFMKVFDQTVREM
jgi:hypothetical protein